MDIAGLLNNKAIKSTEKRSIISDAIQLGSLTIQDIQALKGALDDPKMALILEAMEAITGKHPEAADLHWLTFTQAFISSPSNSIKRETSRIVGNIAHLFPNNLEAAIQKLLVNTSEEGSVIRWSSAYALSRIVSIPQYATSELFDMILALYERETDNGIKNQYLNGLKKARKIRNIP